MIFSGLRLKQFWPYSVLMAFILSIMVLASFALLAGGVFAGRRDGWTIKPILMIVLAAVIFGNVAMLSIPNERGLAPAEADFKN